MQLKAAVIRPAAEGHPAPVFGAAYAQNARLSEYLIVYAQYVLIENLLDLVHRKALLPECIDQQFFRSAPGSPNSSPSQQDIPSKSVPKPRTSTPAASAMCLAWRATASAVLFA